MTTPVFKPFPGVQITKEDLVFEGVMTGLGYYKWGWKGAAALGAFAVFVDWVPIPDSLMPVVAGGFLYGGYKLWNMPP